MLALSVDEITPRTIARLRERLRVRTMRYPRMTPDLIDDALGHALRRAVTNRYHGRTLEHRIILAARDWLFEQINNPCSMDSGNHLPSDLFAESLSTAAPSALDAITTREQYEALHTALGALSPRDRDVLQAHYFEGEPLRSIAARTGIEPTSINSVAMRARQRLRETLDRAA
jgi:RNA polymerase sigma factor (sigma-70 family)